MATISEATFIDLGREIRLRKSRADNDEAITPGLAELRATLQETNLPDRRVFKHVDRLALAREMEQEEKSAQA